MSSQETSPPARRLAPPIATWVCMLLALIMTIVLIPVSDAVVARVGTRTSWPSFFVCLPVILGVVGMGFAAFRRRYVWAAISAAWGVVSILVWFIWLMETYVP